MAQVPTKKQSIKPHKSDDSADLTEAAIVWQADKFIAAPQDSRWISSVVMIGGAAIIVAVVLRNYLEVSLWLVIPVLVLATLGLLRRSFIKPTQGTFGIHEQGIIIDGEVVPFEQFKSFGVLDFDNHHILRLWSTRRFGLPQSIIIEDVAPADVEELLGEVLPQETAEETLSDRISRIVGM